MIQCKSPQEIEIMRIAGKIVALTHKKLKQQVAPRITTRELDVIAEKYILDHDAFPSFKGYNGFRDTICVSVNDELVHGIPSDRVLTEGDIVTIDIGVKYHGFHSDSAWTYPVGSIDNETQKLLDVTEESLYQGLNEARPGERLSNISHAIQNFVETKGFSIVREYAGHGIGQELHEEPIIPHYGPPEKGPRLQPGMVLCIEPMVNAGSRFVRTLEDQWTVVTVDGRMCAHFEHTIAITDTGYEILTVE